MKKSKLSTVLILVIVILAAGWLVAANVFFGKFTGSFHLTDGHAWTDISYEVKSGEADKFSAQLTDPDCIEVKYDGEEDLMAEITLRDDAGETGNYELTLRTVYDTTREEYEIESELNAK